MDAAGFLGLDGDRWDVRTELHGAFGGAFGGAVAAAALQVARPLVAGRAPVALDCRFLRALPAGGARLTPTVVHAGRTLATAVVDVVDHRDRLAARATITFVDPTALADTEGVGAHIRGNGGLTPAPPRSWAAVAPIVETLQPRSMPAAADGIATTVAVPWDDQDAGAEAVCLAADMSVGPPVGAALAGRAVAHPNPDLSLRFGPAIPAAPEFIAVASLVAIRAGIALTSVEVTALDEVVATGISCSLVLNQGGSP